MKKLISLYKPSSLVDAIFSTMALCTFLYYRKEDMAGYIFIAFFYISILMSLFIGNKIIKSTEERIKTTEEYIIVGYIATVIKIIIAIILLVIAVYFLIPMPDNFPFTTGDISYYIAIATFFIWNTFSILNSTFYFFIARLHKKIQHPEIDEIGIHN